MRTELYRIDGPWPGWLAMAPRPRGGDWLGDEMRAWRRYGADVVISMLTPDEIQDLRLDREAQYCAENGMELLSFPVEDRSFPRSEIDVVRLLDRLDGVLSRGENVVVHCRQGVGRSGLLAAGLLLLRGLSPEEAVRRTTEGRGAPVPETEEQRAWLDHLAKTLVAGQPVGD